MDNSNAEFRRHSRRLFSVLRAIVRRSSDSAGTTRDFASRLESRIGALSRVHEMIMRSPREGIDFEELVHGELLAQAIPAARCRVSGPDTRISGEAVFPLALALHELAVNSVLHGAFVGNDGSLDIRWQHLERDRREWLSVVWRESSPQSPAGAPLNSGFGLEVIERSLPYELDATCRIAWPPGGAVIEMEFPAGQKFANWVRGERMPSP